MNSRGWVGRIACAMLVTGLVFYGMEALAAEAGGEAGIEKETMFSLIAKGGYLMIPLAIASILALTLGLERFIALSKQRILPDSFLDGLVNAWEADPTGKQAIRFCDESVAAVA